MATRISYQFNNLLGTVYRQGNLLFSKDGNMLYAAVGNRVSGFDLVRSKCFTFPFEARRNISRIALSPDGAILLALDDEGHLLMANVVRRVVVHHLNLKHSVSDVKFSPDGKWVAFAVGRLVQVWATPTLERSFTPFALHKTLGGHADDITCLAWSADSLFIASGGKDMSVRVHSVHRLPGYAPPTLTGHRSTIRAVYFDAEGETIYAVTRDSALSVWELTPRPDADTAEVKQSQEEAVAEGGAGRGEHAIGCWWTLTARHYFDKDHAKVASAALHMGTSMLVIGFVNGVFALYELPSRGRKDAASVLGTLPDAPVATGTGVGSSVHEPGGKLVEIHSLSVSEARVDACAVSPTGEWLAFGCAALGQLLVWEWRSESYVLKQQGHFYAEIHALAYSPAGSVIATAGGDCKVKLWSPSSGYCFVTFTGTRPLLTALGHTWHAPPQMLLQHTSPVVDVCFVPHGRALITASLDGTCRAYDLVRYRNFQTLVAAEPCQFGCVAVEPSGEIVCAGSRDTMLVYVWNLQTAQLLETLAGHEGPISCLQFGSDVSGTAFLASGSWDKTVRVWDFLSSKSAVDVLRHDSDITAVCFSPDGGTLAAATLDGQIAIWDAKEAEQTGTIDGRADLLGGRSSVSKASKKNAAGTACFQSLAFSADGTAVLACGHSKYACLYDVPQKHLLRKYALSDNVSLDGVKTNLNSKDLLPDGTVAEELLLDDDSDDPSAPMATAKGVLRRSERITKLAIRASCARFSPDGRSFAVASTEGLMVYSLDDALQFDPTGLELSTTPFAVGLALSRGEFGRAMPMALCLNESALIKTAMLVWMHQLMLAHATRLRNERESHEVPLRALHKAVCTRYDDLSKLCHGNLFSLRFIKDQLQMHATAA